MSAGNSELLPLSICRLGSVPLKFGVARLVVRVAKVDVLGAEYALDEFDEVPVDDELVEK